MSHPFIEYHEDFDIGNLMWRIERRTRLIFDSQEAAEIDELERLVAKDRAELAKLKEAL